MNSNVFVGEIVCACGNNVNISVEGKCFHCLPKDQMVTVHVDVTIPKGKRIRTDHYNVQWVSGSGPSFQSLFAKLRSRYDAHLRSRLKMKIVNPEVH